MAWLKTVIILLPYHSVGQEFGQCLVGIIPLASFNWWFAWAGRAKKTLLIFFSPLSLSLCVCVYICIYMCVYIYICMYVFGQLLFLIVQWSQNCQTSPMVSGMVKVQCPSITFPHSLGQCQSQGQPNVKERKN